jgi:hypothetical protein
MIIASFYDFHVWNFIKQFFKFIAEQNDLTEESKFKFLYHNRNTT